MDLLNRLFDLLNENKKFPSYQAERRIDIFINLFLEQMLEEYYHGSKVTFIAPEFPIKKQDTYQSTKIDYLCLKQQLGKKEIIFVELKTDSASFSLKQHDIYKKIQYWDECLTGLREIITKGTMNFREKLKYTHLLKVLARYRLVDPQEISIPLATANTEFNRSGKKNFSQSLNKVLDDIVINQLNYPVKLLYIAPKSIEKNKDWQKVRPELLSFTEISKMTFEDYNEEWKVIREKIKLIE